MVILSVSLADSLHMPTVSPSAIEPERYVCMLDDKSLLRALCKFRGSLHNFNVNSRRTCRCEKKGSWNEYLYETDN